MRTLFRRIAHAIHRRRLDAELMEELDFHRAMKQRDLEGAGLSPSDAAHATARVVGSAMLARDHTRDIWCPAWLQGLGQDVRLAVRTLTSTKLVTSVAVLSLGLGIGANTAIFSLVDSVLLRALPVKNPQHLVTLSTPRSMELGGTAAGWPNSIWEQLRERSDLFDGAAVWSQQRFNLTRGGETAFVDGLLVNGSFFTTLGVPAVLGRVFTDADDRRGGGRDGAVAVISTSFWQTRFGGRGDAIGRTIDIENVPFTIIGITPPNFFGVEVGRTFDVAVPIGDEPLIHGGSSWLDRGNFYWLRIIARLKPGDPIAAAAARLRAVQPQIREATVRTLPPMPKPLFDSYLTGREGFALVPAATGVSLLREQYERPLIILLVAVGLVLLIACANIANLQLARAAARRQEISVRTALGASGWRVGRQMFTESAVLAVAGAAVGLTFASWTSRLLVRQLSTPMGPVFLDLSTDLRVLVFTVVVTIATTLAFGVVPAVHASRAQPMDALKTDDRRASGGSSAISSGLIVAQVALSLLLVVAVGLFGRTFTSLASRDLGFHPGGVLLVTIDAQHVAIDAAQIRPIYERVANAARVIPGVADAALSAVTPVQGGGMLNTIAVSGGATVPKTVRGGIANTWLNIVSPGWFHSLGITLMAGRDFNDRDREGSPRVAIVNQALARTFLDGQSPLGHVITSVPQQGPPMTIVGVVADAVYESPREGAPPTVFTPLTQVDRVATLRALSLSVRAAAGPPSALTKSVAEAIAGVNPRLSLTFRPLSDQVDASLAQERLIATLSAGFGALALLLAGLGLYGVMSYAVARRRTELGLRLALGAHPSMIVRLVLSRAVGLVATGLAIGLIVSIWASHFIATLLYGLTPRDPVTLASAVTVLIAVAAGAAVLPAWRAARIDPATTLRYE